MTSSTSKDPEPGSSKDSVPYTPGMLSHWDNFKSGKWFTMDMILRWSSTLVCYIVGLMTFLMFSSNKYAQGLQDTFQLTQTQLELIFSLNFFGLAGTLPIGMFVQRFGSRAGSALALVLSTGSYLLIANACTNSAFYSQHVGLLTFWFFLAGCGSGAMFIVIMTVSVRNFSESVRGIVIGIMQTAFSLGPIIVGLIYDAYFYDTLNVYGFFVWITCTITAVNVFGILIFSDSIGYKEPEDDEVFETKKELEDAKEAEERTALVSDEKEWSLWDISKTWYFWVIFYGNFVLNGLEPMNVDNLTTYTKSLDLEEYSKNIPYMNPIVGMLSKPLIGFLADALSTRVCLSTWLIWCSAADVVVFLLSLYFLHYLSILVIQQLVVDVGAYAVIILSPLILTKEFGVKNLPKSFAFCLVSWGAGAFIWQVMLGALYDAQIDTANGEITCYGQKCFFVSFIIIAISCALSLAGWIVYRIKRDKPL